MAAFFGSPALEGLSTHIVSVRVKHHMVLVSTPLHHHLYLWEGALHAKIPLRHVVTHVVPPKFHKAKATPVQAQKHGRSLIHAVSAVVTYYNSNNNNNFSVVRGVIINSTLQNMLKNQFAMWEAAWDFPSNRKKKTKCLLSLNSPNNIRINGTYQLFVGILKS